MYISRIAQWCKYFDFFSKVQHFFTTDALIEQLELFVKRIQCMSLEELQKETQSLVYIYLHPCITVGSAMLIVENVLYVS